MYYYKNLAFRRIDSKTSFFTAYSKKKSFSYYSVIFKNIFNRKKNPPIKQEKNKK